MRALGNTPFYGTKRQSRLAPPNARPRPLFDNARHTHDSDRPVAARIAAGIAKSHVWREVVPILILQLTRSGPGAQTHRHLWCRLTHRLSAGYIGAQSLIDNTASAVVADIGATHFLLCSLSVGARRSVDPRIASMILVVE